MKRTLLAVLMIGVLVATFAIGADITTLTGLTGKLGKEDVNWGTGESTDQFSVPTYGGSTVSLTKIPDLDANAGSRIKEVWYVSNDAAITDHSVAATAGAAAWVLAKISTNEGMIVFPSKDTTYAFLADTTFPANVGVRLEHGAVIAPATTKNVTFSGTLISFEPAYAGGAGTVTVSGVETIYVSGATEDIADHESRITTLEGNIGAAYGSMYLYTTGSYEYAGSTGYQVLAPIMLIGENNSALTLDTTNGTMTATTTGAGVYHITFRLLEQSTATITAQVNHSRGSTVTPLEQCEGIEAYAGGTQQVIDLSCITGLIAGDVLDVRVKGHTAVTVDAIRANFSAHR